MAEETKKGPKIKQLDSLIPYMKGSKVTIYFSNPAFDPVKGELLAYSRYDILLMGPDGHEVIMKHAIRSIKPDKPIELKKLYEGA